MVQGGGCVLETDSGPWSASPALPGSSGPSGPPPPHPFPGSTSPASCHLGRLPLPRLCLQPRHFINYSVTGQATKVGFSPAIFETLELLKPSSPRIVSIW